MAKKKPSSDDRHKPSRMVRLSERVARQLDIMAERHDASLTEEVRRAVIEYLEREGLWPPKPTA